MSSSPKGRARKGVVSLLSSLVVAMLLLFGLASPASAAELVFVEPPEVTWVDLCGVDSDTYTIPPSDEVAYLVDGMTTEPGTYPGEVGETTVEAVLIVEDNEEFWYLLDGTTTWYLSFTDEPCVGDPAGDLNASSSTCETISVSYANITPEGAAVEIRVDGETVTGDVVDVEAGEYSVELVVNGVVVDSVTVSVSECPVDPGPKPNPVVEQVVVESDPDCVSRTVTVTTTTTTTDWELSSDGTQWVKGQPSESSQSEDRPATEQECPPPPPIVEDLHEERMSCEGNLEERLGTTTTDWEFDENSWTWVETEPFTSWGAWDFVRQLTEEELAELDFCEQPPVDVCPNIDGDQTEIPEGSEVNDAGDCIKTEEPPEGPEKPKPPVDKPEEPKAPVVNPPKAKAPAGPTTPRSGLPATGSNAQTLLQLGGLLLAGGVAMLAIRRRDPRLMK